MFLKIFSVFALVYLSIALCPINKDLDNVISDSISFLNSSLDGQSIIYTFKNSFIVVPKVSLAIYHFDIKAGNIGNFSVTPLMTRQNDITFRFFRAASAWNKLRINFFAGIRSDLIIGTGYSQFPGIVNTTALTTVNFQTDIPNYTRSIIRVFLNGFEYKGSVVHIQISGRKLDARQLTVNIQVENDFFLNKIYFSFVVFAPTNVPYASYGGLIAESSFTGFYYEDAHKIIYNSNYQLYGLNKITLSGKQAIQFASIIDQDQVAGLYSSRNFDELNFIFIIIGVAPVNQCSKCSSTQVYGLGDTCVSSCPAGTYSYKYNDNGLACRACSEKLNQVLSNGKCVCNSNSVNQDGICVISKGSPYNFLSELIKTSSSSGSEIKITIPSITSSTTSSSPQSSSQIIPITDGSCTNSNQYWTGYRCACKVGFKNQSNNCTPLYLLKTKGWIVREPTIQSQQSIFTDSTPNTTVPIENNCYMQYQYFNGQGCVCIDKYVRVNGVCVLGNSSSITQAQCISQANKQWVNNSCVCKGGYILVNGNCLININKCGTNSYDNGLGVCICDNGYYKDSTGVCIKGVPCPPNSSRNVNGTCACDDGLTMYDNYCSKCPNGAIWDSKSSKCVYVCGQKANYNQSLKKCQCLAGYGIYDHVCTTCPKNLFIINNYCVQCPINSFYDKVTNKCKCNDGYLLNPQGMCIQKCLINQVYDLTTGSCKCYEGLGRVNNTCQICPTGTRPVNNSTQKCDVCGVNQKLIEGKCICNEGFAPNALGVCVACANVPNSFLVNRKCAVCPGQLIYNSNSKKCQCPLGQFRVGSNCFDTCKSDQLLDSNNYCYSCPINEMIIDKNCVCQKGYIRNNSTSRCQLSCKKDQFIYKGKCAQCPTNLIFRSQINGCSCSDGLYLNTYGVCEKVVLIPLTCDTGYFFSSTSGCTKCSSDCATCSSANNCTSCSVNGFSVYNGKCQGVCGDGIIVTGEACDDGNSNSRDGCSSTCTVQTYFTCLGQPSICKYNGPAICGNGRVQGNQQCDDGNTVNSDGCSSLCKLQTKSNNTFGNISLVGQVNTNINNVFVVLRTSKKYTFANEAEMEGFMKTSFPDSTSIPTVYCSQRQSPDLDLYDCLAIYSSGIPNKKYNIVFYYDWNGEKGKIQVNVDPLKSSLPTRSLGRN